MRRPTRKRRLSIAAIVSLFLFAVVAAAGVRSCFISDEWVSSLHDRLLLLDGGKIFYRHDMPGPMHGFEDDPRFQSSPRGIPPLQAIDWKFEYINDHSKLDSGDFRAIEVQVPLWFPLVLLLILPVMWLVARPTNAPTFPVMTDAKNEA